MRAKELIAALNLSARHWSKLALFLSSRLRQSSEVEVPNQKPAGVARGCHGVEVGQEGIRVPMVSGGIDVGDGEGVGGGSGNEGDGNGVGRFDSPGVPCRETPPLEPLAGTKLKSERWGDEGFAFERVDLAQFGFLQVSDVWVRDGDGVADIIAFVLAAKPANVPRHHRVDEMVPIHGNTVTSPRQ